MKEAPCAWPAGLKKTKQRESVLAVLEQADQPLSAVEICGRMETGVKPAWLSTVYRVLEQFVEKGIVMKTSVLNSEMAVYELNRFRHKHYAVCVKCHKMIAIDDCPMNNAFPKLEAEDFEIMGHSLEIFGYCKDCKHEE